jgi:hypothetical protein
MEPEKQVLTPEQRTSGWFKDRLGKVTASRVSDTMEYYVPTKANLAIAAANHTGNTDLPYLEYLLDNYPAEYCLSAGVELKEKEVRKKYREGIVAERLTGLLADPEPYVSYDMKWGIANENIARNVYQMEAERLITDAPFLQHPTLMAGASPDGWVVNPATGEVEASAEIKCLRSANHLYKTILTNKVPPEHLPQIHMQMWIAGMPKVIFIAYDSRVPEGLKIFTATVERDEMYLKMLEASVRRFLKECDNDFKHFWAQVRNKPKLENGVVAQDEVVGH